MTSDGEAFVGDTLKFKDGYKARITSIIKTGYMGSYIVILKDIYNKTKKCEIPLNGKASWRCSIE